jgi:hypothetical protein
LRRYHGNSGRAQFKVLGAVNEDLQRQVTELETSSQVKDVETARLREQLSMLSPQRQEAESKRRIELEKFIQRVDQEIAQKKKEGPVRRAHQMIYIKNEQTSDNCPGVSDHSPPPPPPPEKREKSAFEVRHEKELAALASQRDEARRKLIELIVK